MVPKCGSQVTDHGQNGETLVIGLILRRFVIDLYLLFNF